MLVPVSADEQTAGWSDVFSEDFEGDFPGQWTVSVAAGKTDAYWGKEDYDIFHQADPYDGNYAAYCVKGGSASVTLPGHYPNNMDTRMTCGPFDLSHATDANLIFNCKPHIENNHDILEYSVSLDGSNFFGGRVTESSTDAILALDLKNVPSLGNICGQPQVWVSFRFTSDDSPDNGLGIIIDDVVLSQFVPVGLPPQITSINPDTASAGTGSQVTITGTEFGETVNSVEFWRMSRTRLSANIISWSDTEIVCTVPSGASGSDEMDGILYGVRVSGPGGWSEDFPFNVTFSYNGIKFLRTNPMGARFVVNDITSDCEGVLEAIINAAQTWNSVPNADFYFEYGGTDQPGTFEILWRDNGPGPTGYASSMQDPATGEIIAGTIVLNDYYDWSTDDSNNYDIQSVVSHEFGHWLILSDLYGEQNRGKMMFGGAQERTLAPEDIEGIRWIYPGTGTRGQYHVKVTNNSVKDLSVYFKADINTDLSPVLDVPAGQTVTSWCRVVEAGVHQVNIEWIDPIDGIKYSLLSQPLDIPIEGDTEYSFTIPGEPPENHPPTLSPIGDKEVTVGQSLTFTVSATDVDNDTLTYSASNLPTAASFDAFTRIFSWTPSAAGTYSGVHFEVSDSEFNDSEEITITVSPTQPEKYTLTVNINGEGAVSRNPDLPSYDSGTSVQLTATPTTGWFFSEWSGDLTGSENPGTIIISGNRTVTATFIRKTPAPGGGGGGGGGGSTGTTSLSEFVTNEGKFVVDATAESADGKVKISIPKGTIGKNRNGQRLSFISIKNKTASGPPDDCVFVCPTYDIGPEGSTFNPPIYLTFLYNDLQIPAGVAEDNLVVTTWQDGKWVEFEGCTVDPVKNTITVPISHFTIFTVMAHTSAAKFEVAGMTVTPAEVNPEASVTVSITVTNIGDLTDSYTILLKINNSAVQDKAITLKGGESQTVSFTVTPGAAGVYAVSVGGLSGKFTVNEPEPEGTVADVSGPESSTPSPTPTAQAKEKSVTPTQPEREPVVTVQTPIEMIPPQAIAWWFIVIYIACGVIVVGLGAYFFMRTRSSSE